LLGIESGHAANYNPDAAYNYAYKFFNKVVSDGYFWTTPYSDYLYGAGQPVPTGSGLTDNIGDDCAHFVSCVIGAESHENGGGLPLPDALPYGIPSNSNLGEWLLDKGYGIKMSSLDQLVEGDVVNFDWNCAHNDGRNYDHIAFYLGNKTFAQHSSSQWDFKWARYSYACHRFIHIISSTSPQMPLPTVQQSFPYSPVVSPSTSADPSQTYPIGVGSVANGGNTVSLQVSFPQFSAPVDIYLGIYAPGIDPNVWIIKPDLSLQPASNGLVKWKENTTGPINEDLYVDIPISTLSSGTYNLAALVTPAGNSSFDAYYLWATNFIIANAAPSRTFNLTLSTAGSGTGSVSSSPAGINDCTGTCSASFDQGTSVTLSATPSTGSTFAGWLVNGSNSICPLTGNCTTSIDANESVTATFNAVSVAPLDISGTWTLNAPCSSSTQYFWYIYSNGTFADNIGGSGTWTVSGNQFTLAYNDTSHTIYKGSFNSSGTYMTGSRSNDNGTDPDAWCATLQTATCPDGNGLYCGSSSLGQNTNYLYQCTNGNYTVSQQCSNGCQQNAPGTNDSCKSAQTCPDGNGLYCGSSSLGQNTNYLYQCTNGNYTVSQQCSNGCQQNAPGTDDSCKTASTCPNGNGLYCGNSSLGQNTNYLYQCTNGNYTLSQQCSSGCQQNAPGTNDSCKVIPGSVSVSPSSGSWSSSPQYATVSSSGASQIFCSVSVTTDGSTPADPPDPTASNSSCTQAATAISGSSGSFQMWANQGQYKRFKVKFRGHNSVGYGPTSGIYSYTINIPGVPGSVSVSPSSGSWTSSPHYLNVSSSGSTIIYFTMVNTYDGSAPPRPSDPSPSLNDGHVSGPSGSMQLYGSSGKKKRLRIRFTGCNSFGCGSASDSFYYTIDLR
jgi:Divergent InlB B-repeat domain